VEWERTLLSLTPAACAHLLDYWDTLTPVPLGEHSADGAQAHPTACSSDAHCGDRAAVATSTPEPYQPTTSNGSATTSNNSSTRTSTQVPDLDAFFEQLFAPCGDNVTKVRYLRYTHNYTTAVTECTRFVCCCIQVRRHLLQQKNRHNETVARRLLGSILGMNLS
jgi:hypothetical protein